MRYFCYQPHIKFFPKISLRLSPCLCSLLVRVPGYRTELYCVSCEVRTEFIYVEVGRLCGLVVKSSWLQIQGSGFDTQRYKIF
jgi:hypothetical protein